MRRGLQLALLAVVLGLVFPGSVVAFGPLSSFGEFGGGAGQLDAPAQLAVAPNGDVYVADAGNDRISIFAPDGTFLRSLGEGKLLEPKDVALDGGRVLVADTGHDRVAVFSTLGVFLNVFGCACGLLEPSGVAIDSSSFATTVHVADTGHDRVASFTSTGSPLASIESVSSPRDVIIGSSGDLYVADFGNERIGVFSKAGAFVDSFGDTGSGPGELSGPVALAGGAGGVYVADQTAQRLVHFDAAGSFLDVADAVPNVAGVGVGCGGNVFATEQETMLARVQRFGEPDTPPPPCAAPPAEPVQVSLTPTPSNKFRFAGLTKNRSNGFAVLYVRVPGPGRVKLSGRGFRRLSRSAPQAMQVRLPIKPKVRLRHFLKRHGKGRIRVEVTFLPVGGVPRSIERVIVLRRKRR